MRERNILRTGKVSGIDYENGMMQVLYTDKGKSVTASLPYASFNDEYCMPKIGEQVLVAHLSNGSSRGVVLGSMWNRKNMPEENGKGLYRKELSKARGAAYIRYEDGSGEYLVAVPTLKLHGIDRAEVGGPEVHIGANIRTSFESPEHMAILQAVTVRGLEGADIEAMVASNVKVLMDAAGLEATAREVKLETLEEFGLVAGRSLEAAAQEDIAMAAGKGISVAADGSVAITAKKDVGTSTDGNVSMAAGRDIRLEDATFSTTLSEIMGRLEALDGNTAARK